MLYYTYLDLLRVALRESGALCLARAWALTAEGRLWARGRRSTYGVLRLPSAMAPALTALLLSLLLGGSTAVPPSPPQAASGTAPDPLFGVGLQRVPAVERPSLTAQPDETPRKAELLHLLHSSAAGRSRRQLQGLLGGGPYLRLVVAVLSSELALTLLLQRFWQQENLYWTSSAMSLRQGRI